MNKFSYPITPVGHHISPYNIPINPVNNVIQPQQPIIEPEKPVYKPNHTIYYPNIPNGRRRLYKSPQAAQRAYDRYHREQARLKAIEAIKAKQADVNINKL
jgi:hypothetical protein